MVVSLLVGKNGDLTPVACKRYVLLDFHAVYTNVIDVNIEVLKEPSDLPAERARVEEVKRWGLTHEGASPAALFKARSLVLSRVSNPLSRIQGRPAIQAILCRYNSANETLAPQALHGARASYHRCPWLLSIQLACSEFVDGGDMFRGQCEEKSL